MPRKEQFQKREPKDDFEQKIIDLARVTRVMAGGKRLRFRVCMVIGNHNGQVGYGVAKGTDVSIAIGKAVVKAKKNIIDVPLVNDSIPHAIKVKFKSANLLLKPAPQGTGIIAGGAVRQVLELAGVPNVVAKILGCNNKISNVKAVFKALESLQTVSGKRQKQIDEKKLESAESNSASLKKAEKKIVKKKDNK